MMNKEIWIGSGVRLENRAELEDAGYVIKGWGSADGWGLQPAPGAGEAAAYVVYGVKPEDPTPLISVVTRGSSALRRWADTANRLRHLGGS